MTTKASAVVAALIASLAVAAPASAQTLSLTTATKLAKQLASEQLDSNRDVIRYHVYRGKRISATRIHFAYDDRTRTNVFCKATIVVRRIGRTTTATFRTRAACARIPSEVLAFEAVTRAAARAVIAQGTDVRSSARAFTRSLRACRTLNLPRSRIDEAELLLNVGSLQALERPVDAQLGDFVAGLAAVGAVRPALAAGAAAWADYLAVVRALPSLPNPCATLHTWEDDGYAADKAPVDFAALRALDKRGSGDLVRIARAARFMANAGAFPTAAVNFTPDGLIFRERIDVGITGG